MTEPDFFDCELLKATISARQCFANAIRAWTLKYINHSPGHLACCLTCSKWKAIQVSLAAPEAREDTGGGEGE